LKKRYTIEEVNNLLPNVEKRVKKIVSLRRKVKNLSKVYVDGCSDELFDVDLLKLELEEIYGKLTDEVQKFDCMGVIVKDFDKGIVDFISRFEGRDVLLCWMLGEDKIKYWCEFGESFTERKPIIYIN
tara:strand:+ start:2558 stop:2941 length:384 start_codon:yes stop_codon:yes gene_type:complete